MQATPTWRRVWGEVWRVLVAALAGLILWGTTAAVIDMGEAEIVDPDWLFFDLVIGGITCLLLLLRRRWPLLIACLIMVLSGASVFAMGAATLALISLSTRRRWREVALVLLLSIGAWVANEYFYPVDGWGDRMTNHLVGLAFLAAAVALGAYIGGRRDYVRMLSDRADTAEREQVSRVAEARALERSRIAREMHDVLAHRISLIAMHAGALAYREDLTQEQVRQVAGLLRDNSDQAVQELRQVLGVLRGSTPAGAEDHLAPQPSLDRLSDLATEARAAGSAVQVTTTVTEGVPTTTSRTAYRIVQEALTNARKHAPGAPVRVTVTGGPKDGVSVEIRNEPAPEELARSSENGRGSGMGLVGLTERAVLAGGTLSYGTDRAGRFVLRAWLPWAHDEASTASEPEPAPTPAAVTRPPWVPPSSGGRR